MDAPLQHRIRRIGFELAHSSVGWLAAGYSLVVMVALTAGFRTPAHWVATHFWVMLPMILVSLLIGMVVHYSYQRWSRHALRKNGLLPWRNSSLQQRSYVHEASVGLSIFLLLAIGYSCAMYAASRAANRISAECSGQFTAQLLAKGAENAAAISRASCECLVQIFFQRNGVFRMALFDTRLLGSEDFIPVDETDEALCTNAALNVFPSPRNIGSSSIFRPSTFNVE